MRNRQRWVGDRAKQGFSIIHRPRRCSTDPLVDFAELAACLPVQFIIPSVRPMSRRINPLWVYHFGTICLFGFIRNRVSVSWRRQPTSARFDEGSFHSVRIRSVVETLSGSALRGKASYFGAEFSRGFGHASTKTIALFASKEAREKRDLVEGASEFDTGKAG